MSQPIGNNFKSRIPTFSDDASIQEAFSVYHYGKDNYTESEAVPTNSIEGHFVSANNRIGALESVVDDLGETYVLKISPTIDPNVIKAEDGSSTPLTIRGRSGQSVALQRWENVSETAVISVFNDGGAVFANYLTIGGTAKSSSTGIDLRVGAGHKGITVVGSANHTENLQEWKFNDGSTTSVVARVSASGKIFSNNGLSGVNTSEVVTESGSQTLTNKTIDSSENTVVGLAALTGATFTGQVSVVSPTAAGSNGVRQITISTAAPSGGNNGDVWIRYVT